MREGDGGRWEIDRLRFGFVIFYARSEGPLLHGLRTSRDDRQFLYIIASK